MDQYLFYAFGAIAVGASLAVIGQRNPMHSVLWLIASFIGLSGLYVLLDAPFTAVTQIIIYAGAIMVLFLFVVMLLNTPREDPPVVDPRRPMLSAGPRRAGGVLSLVFLAEILWAMLRVPERAISGDAQVVRPRVVGRPDRPRAVHHARVRLRGDDGAAAGGDDRGRGAGQEGAVMPGLNHFLMLSGILFSIGTAGVFLRRNVITILLSIEIMLNAVNLTFVAVGRQLGSVEGQIIVFFVMTVAACEAAVGLAIVIQLFRQRETLSPDAFTSLKW